MFVLHVGLVCGKTPIIISECEKTAFVDPPSDVSAECKEDALSLEPVTGEGKTTTPPFVEGNDVVKLHEGKKSTLLDQLWLNKWKIPNL